MFSFIQARRVVVVWVLAMCTIGEAGAQTSREGDGGLVLPVFSLGASAFLGDFGESSLSSAGLIVGAGLRFPNSTVALTMARWLDIDEFRLYNVQLELMMDLANKGFATPYMAVGIGRTWSDFLFDGPAC